MNFGNILKVYGNALYLDDRWDGPAQGTSFFELYTSQLLFALCENDEQTVNDLLVKINTKFIEHAQYLILSNQSPIEPDDPRYDYPDIQSVTESSFAPVVALYHRAAKFKIRDREGEDDFSGYCSLPVNSGTFLISLLYGRTEIMTHWVEQATQQLLVLAAE